MAINITLPDDLLTFNRYEYKNVRDTLKLSPAGVYFLYNSDNELLYVGKTNDFRTRLLAHFRGRDNSRDFYKLIDHVTVYFVDNEFERELYETYAINTYKPVYNIAKAYYADNTDERYEIEEKIRELEEEAEDIREDMLDDGLIDRDFEEDTQTLTGIYFHNVERLGEIDSEIIRLKKRLYTIK